ncbi:MAG: ABC transporter ATP-binding protein [Vicinamibacteria bacterium]
MTEAIGIVLKTVDLRKTYRVGKVEVPALRGVNVDVHAGEFVSIMGPSGCGKSTLLHLLGGLCRPSSGRIFLDGIDLSAASDAERTRLRRQKIGFVFQRFNLLPTLTVQGNLEIARQIFGNGYPDRRELTELVEVVGLSHKLHHKPVELSVGEQQRVAVARALVNQPAIILADEPTGNLDSQNSRQVLELLAELNRTKKQTILMITHNPEAAEVGHRVIELLDGRVVDHAQAPHLVNTAGELC